MNSFKEALQFNGLHTLCVRTLPLRTLQECSAEMTMPVNPHHINASLQDFYFAEVMTKITNLKG
jgi:hypothetical protein